MPSFVNRTKELQIVEERCNALLEKNRPVQTQFIEFYGVGGIGKTTVLEKVELQCNESNLYSVWIDASQSAVYFSRNDCRSSAEIWYTVYPGERVIYLINLSVQ